MVIGCGKRQNGSGCTIASLFPKTSCWWTSTGLQRLRRRDRGACVRTGQLQRLAISDRRQSLPDRSMWNGCPAASIRTGAITPLLGGIGPMSIARLMHNTLIAASMRSGLGVPLLRQT
ncbi:hypothetical protein GR253_09580 [Rhizobium leguminosarum]|nr:hypothetical protein [Rhizobium leguminosarum]